VVTAIVGLRAYTLKLVGQQNHAGTTPMPMRKDAGLSALILGARLDEAFKAIAGEKTVWTFGDVTFEPGARSIVPGAAEMMLQFRDVDAASLDRFAATVHEVCAAVAAERNVEIIVQDDGGSGSAIPKIMDDKLQAHVAAACERHAPGEWVHMPSGAGHDAMIFADHLPTAMLFVPSIEGISHSFEEDTSDPDIVLGCQVYADAIAMMLLQEQPTAEGGGTAKL
jgi:N-carbamoyl-L-amino-acid hydrolase